MDRGSTAKSSTNKRQEASAGFYKRVHGTSEQSGSESPAFVFYYAAAEDDSLGWSLGDERVDPMYTMRRREREQEANSKTSFYKKLKARIGQSEPGPNKPEPQSKGAESVVVSSVTTASPVAAIAVASTTSATRFGFGMMGSAPAASGGLLPDNKPKKDKSKSSKKDKDGIDDKASKRKREKKDR
ncbi:hypothetical protein GGI02_006089, partial [Coemansia sp. RSA 2322]